jgi:hypothetical protein
MISQLLEGIGVISSSDAKKATYQDSVLTPLSRDYDDEDIPQTDDVDVQSSTNSSAGILSAIQKVSYPCANAMSLMFSNN